MATRANKVKSFKTFFYSRLNVEHKKAQAQLLYFVGEV